VRTWDIFRKSRERTYRGPPLIRRGLLKTCRRKVREQLWKLNYIRRDKHHVAGDQVASQYLTSKTKYLAEKTKPVWNINYLACSKPYKSAADDSTTDPSPMVIRLLINGSWKQRNHDLETWECRVQHQRLAASTNAFPSFHGEGRDRQTLVLFLARWWNCWHANMTRSWASTSSEGQRKN